MTLRRAALYVGGASLLAAWFSSAASLSLQRPSRALGGDTIPGPSATDDLAANIQRQAARLRQRLASPPLPQQPARNPFAFRAQPPKPRPQAARPVEAAPPAVELPAEPALLLIGLAERKRPEGVVRTAMITTAADDLIMASVGDVVLHRYTVTAIGHDTVELTDVTTGQVRRISLQ